MIVAYYKKGQTTGERWLVVTASTPPYNDPINKLFPSDKDGQEKLSLDAQLKLGLVNGKKYIEGHEVDMPTLKSDLWDDWFDKQSYKENEPSRKQGVNPIPDDDEGVGLKDQLKDIVEDELEFYIAKADGIKHG